MFCILIPSDGGVRVSVNAGTLFCYARDLLLTEETQDLHRQQDDISKSNTGKKDIILNGIAVSCQRTFTAYKEITTLMDSTLCHRGTDRVFLLCVVFVDLTVTFSIMQQSILFCFNAKIGVIGYLTKNQ